MLLIEKQKQFALKDINVNKLDLMNSFYFDTNVVFPSITSVLRKIERFTCRKDIFDLNVMLDPTDVKYPDLGEIIAEKKKREEKEQIEQDNSSEFSSEAEEPQKNPTAIQVSQIQAENASQQDERICRCPSCIIERNNYRWNSPYSQEYQQFDYWGNYPPSTQNYYHDPAYYQGYYSNPYYQNAHYYGGYQIQENYGGYSSEVSSEEF